MPDHDVPDAGVVRRYEAGDQGAAAVLFGRLFPSLRPRLRRRMGAPLRRKVGESDLIQSAFASVLPRLHEFRDEGPGSFRRWVVGILDHKLIDEMRHWQGTKKRDPAVERALEGLSERSVPHARGDSPSRAAMADEGHRRIRAALELLSEEHRTVIRTLHELGLSLGEAAAVMQRSPEAVRKLHARAVGRLAEILEMEGHP